MTGALAAQALVVVGVFAWLSGAPFVFPSLGPTIHLQVTRPDSEAARVRHTVLGHAVGFAVGAGSHQLAGVLAPGSAASPAAAVLALGATSGLLRAFHLDHPPAAASTLIAALGLLQGPRALLVAGVSVCWVAAQGVLVRRLAARWVG